MQSKVIGKILVLAPLVFSFAFALDIYAPAVPDLIKYFHTTQEMVQLTLSLFMIGTGVGQLFFGPLSDQYGRRPIALTSVTLFLFASIACSFATNIYVLIAARFIQSLGGCGMLVVAFAVTKDIFSGDEASEVYSLLNCCIGVSPLIAPTIGSFLVSYLGWRSSFYALAILGILITILVLTKLKESLDLNDRTKMSFDVFGRYLQVLKNKQFLCYTLTASVAMGMFFTFFSMSPYLIINVLHIAKYKFGFYFFFVGLGFFIGSFISAATVAKIGTKKTVIIGLIIAFAAGLIMLITNLKMGLSILNFIVPSVIFAIGGALMLGAGAGGAMQPFEHNIGVAAAVLGSMQFVGAAIICSIVSLWAFTTAIPLASLIILASVISFILIFRIK